MDLRLCRLFVVLVGFALSFVPPGGTNVKVFLVDVIAGTAGSILIGLFSIGAEQEPNGRCIEING